MKEQHLENIGKNISGSLVDFTKYFEKIIFDLIDMIPSFVKASLGLIIGLLIIRTTIKILEKRFEQRNVDISLRGFLLSIIKFLLYALLALVVASNLGFQTTAILGAFSGVVLAIGLALQGSLSNFAGGVLILIFRPFDVGDYIENNAGTDGTVEKIDLLYTTLITAQGIKVFSPNGALANSVIRNYTKIARRRMEFIIGISYNDNIKEAKELILSVLSGDDRVLKTPKTDVFVSSLGDSSVNLTIHFWVKNENFVEVRNDIQERIKVALDKGGINIPFPQCEVKILNQ